MTQRASFAARMDAPAEVSTTQQVVFLIQTTSISTVQCLY